MWEKETVIWLIHPRLGFFSVVVPKDQLTGAREQSRLMVRARTRAHLELLRKHHPVLRQVEILRSPDHADYRWRLLCDRETFVQVMREMVEQIDFTNIKFEGLSHQDLVGADFASAMHLCHALFARLQDKPRGAGGE